MSMATLLDLPKLVAANTEQEGERPATTTRREEVPTGSSISGTEYQIIPPPTVLLPEILELLEELAVERAPRSCGEALQSSRDPRPRQRRAGLSTRLASLGALLVDALLDGEGEQLLSLAQASLPCRTDHGGGPRRRVQALEPIAPPNGTDLAEAARDGVSGTVIDRASPGEGQGPPASATTAPGGGERLEEGALPNPAPTRFPGAPLAPPVQVTPELVADLQQQLRRRALGVSVDLAEREASLGPRTRRRLAEQVKLLGETPRCLERPAEIEQELALLERSLPAPPDHWAGCGRKGDHALTSWVTARARAVQDAARTRGPAAAVRRTDRLFSRLSRHSARSQPGTVHGLARVHGPQRLSWLADARAAEERIRQLVGGDTAPSPSQPNLDDALRQLTDETKAGLDPLEFRQRVSTLLALGLSPTETRLVRLAMPYLPALDGGGFGKLRRAVLKALEAEIPPAPEQEQLPADWPCWSQTRGQRAALLGGIPRAERRKRLQEVFGFASLEWLPDIGIRRVHSLTERMQAGSLDLVIVLRAFTSHTVSAKAFEAETPQCRVILADNYGVNQVRLGLERFCEERANA